MTNDSFVRESNFMKNRILLIVAIFTGKIGYYILQILGKQGTALPGKISLKIYPNILSDLGERCDKTLIITGTNGKTTTNNLINHILNGKYENVVSNLKGANMIQGVITSFIVNTKKQYDWGVFEVDEGSMPKILKYISSPNYIILTNFFRDQLDRYGEVDNTVNLVYNSLINANKLNNFNNNANSDNFNVNSWKNTKETSNTEKKSNINHTTLIINADDPLNSKFNDLPNKKIYYGVEENNFSKEDPTVAEAIFCINCGKRLEYDYINYGNIGKYQCPECGMKREYLNYYVDSIDINNNSYIFNVKVNKKDREKNKKENKKNKTDKKNIVLEKEFIFKYMGIYNIYNCLAAISFGLENGLEIDYIKKRIENFEYKLGRMETIEIPYKNKEVTLILSKNPVGLSEVLSTISYDTNPKTIMFLLNADPADGADISWIWDADIEQIADISNLNKFYAGGKRSEEVSLRIKYAGLDINKIETFSSNESNIKKSIKSMLNNNTQKNYIIGTFTAMPVARKILINEQKK